MYREVHPNQSAEAIFGKIVGPIDPTNFTNYNPMNISLVGGYHCSDSTNMGTIEGSITVQNKSIVNRHNDTKSRNHLINN